MGAFFTNLHVRNASTAAICAALPKLTKAGAYVSPQANDWVTIYSEATEDQSEESLCGLAGGLSKMFKTDVFAFLVHDSDIAMYWLYRCGERVDEFNSCPDAFGETVDDETQARVRGNTDAILPLCIAGTTRAQLDEVLHPAEGYPTFAEEVVTELAKLLGIDDARATLGFKYFEQDGPDILPDIADFQPIGPGTSPKEAEPHAGDAAAPLLPVLEYVLAISMLTQMWTEHQQKSVPAFAKVLKQPVEALLKQMSKTFDKTAREWLKKSSLPNLPTIEELKAARNQGPEAFAKLLAEKTPSQLAEIAVGAADSRLEEFLAALLKYGLDPNGANAAGRTILDAAAQHGTDSSIYKLVKNAADKRK